MAGGSGADFYRSIELGIQATGQAGVNELGSTVGALKLELAGYQNQLKAGAPLNQQMVADIGRTTSELKRAEAAYSAAQRVIKGLPADLAAYNAQLKQQADAQAKVARAAVDSAAAQKQALGDALRDRIEAIARAERAQEDADRAAKQSAGDAMRARIDAYARAERAQEEADRQAKQSAGDAQRARIDAYARADAAQLASVASQKKALADAAAAATKAARTQTDAANSAARGWSQSFLELSRGVEDFAVAGGLGVLNNLPRIAGGIAQGMKLAAPQIAAVEGAVSFLGTAAYITWQNFDRLKAVFDDGLGPKIIPDVKELNKLLDELKDKPPTTLIQVQDIQNLERAVEGLDRINAAIKAQQAQTEEDKKQSAAVNKGITESTGGKPEKIDALVISARRNEVTPETQAIQGQIREKEAAIAAEANEFARDVLDNQLRQLRYDLKQRAPIDAANRLTAAQRLRGAAGAGDDASRAELGRILENNQEYAANQGIDVGKLRKSLQEAADVPKGFDKAAAKDAAREDEFYDRVTQEGADRQSKGMAKLDADYARKVAADKKAADAKAKQAQNAANVIQRQAAAKAKAEQDKQVKDVGKPYVDMATEYLARNKAAQASLPTAATRAQANAYDRSGQAYALSDAEAQRRATLGVAGQLRRANQDPGLAAPIVGKAVEALGDGVGRTMGVFNDQVSALIGVANGAQADLQREQQRAMANWGGIRQLQANAGRARQRKPSLNSL